VRALNIYRACTWTEKRTILSFYWSKRAAPSPRLEAAAREYAPWASVFVGAIWLELLFVTFFFVARQSTWAALGATAASLWSVGLAWALHCQYVIAGRSPQPVAEFGSPRSTEGGPDWL
jgi:hypothetical protein